MLKLKKKKFHFGGLCDTVMDRTEVTGKNEEQRGIRSGNDLRSAVWKCHNFNNNAFKIVLFLLYNQCTYSLLFNFV